MVAISSPPSRSNNNSNNTSPASSSSYSNHSSRNNSIHQFSSCRFLTCLSSLVAAQFLLLPITLHYYLFSTSLLQQQQGPQQNDWNMMSRFPGDSLQQQRQRQQQQQQKSAYNVNDYQDGTFNGAPLRLQTVGTNSSSSLYSRIHCVGENYNTETAWQQRSCEFQHLFCFNTSSQRFVVFQSKSERLLSDFMTQRQYDMHASTTMIRYKANHLVGDIIGTNNTMLPRPQTMSIGGINKKWGDAGIQRLEWFPDIISLSDATLAASDAPGQYYELPPSVIMIPYHSLNGANPGHLIWDDYMPIYTLLTMFHKINHHQHQYQQDRQLLLMRYILDTNADQHHQGNLQRGLWASCDMNEEKTKACHAMMNKFMPLMLGYNTSVRWSTIRDYDFQPATTTTTTTATASNKVDLVCARTGLAGIGSLTDHGVAKLHGWEENDYKTTHNHGRGGLVYDFRNFMLNNLGFAPQHESIHKWRRLNMQAGTDDANSRVLPPHRIVFSQKSSDIPNRNLEFTQQIAAVQKYLPHASVEAYVFKDLSLQEQMQVAVQSSVFITLCGGGAVTGMFLPRGASVILYYDARGGAENNHLTGLPARLDWDLYNAMTHLRVHWLPKNTAKDAVDQMSLVLLIRHELARIDQEAEEYESCQGCDDVVTPP